MPMPMANLLPTSQPGAAECMARGAVMDRHEIVEYALTARDV